MYDVCIIPHSTVWWNTIFSDSRLEEIAFHFFAYQHKARQLNKDDKLRVDIFLAFLIHVRDSFVFPCAATLVKHFYTWGFTLSKVWLTLYLVCLLNEAPIVTNEQDHVVIRPVRLQKFKAFTLAQRRSLTDAECYDGDLLSKWQFC